MTPQIINLQIHILVIANETTPCEEYTESSASLFKTLYVETDLEDSCEQTDNGNETNIDFIGSITAHINSKFLPKT